MFHHLKSMSCCRWEKELVSPSLLYRLPEPSPSPPPPFRPPSVTHAHSPLIGRLPQVAVELGRAPQKRRLRASALASSRCDRGEKKQTHNNDTRRRQDLLQPSRHLLISFHPDESSVAGSQLLDETGAKVMFAPPRCRHPPKALPFEIVIIVCCFISIGTMCVNIYYK